MCTTDTFAQEAAHRRELELTRRGFNLAAICASAIAMLPGAVVAASLKEQRVEVKTSAGAMDAFLVHPASGKAPGVILWPDFMSLRPTYEQLARRLAESGYAVLVVNPYYRVQKAPLIEKATFDDPALLQKVMALMNGTTAEMTEMDAQAAAAFLDAQSAVDTAKPLGTFGFCMGGRMAMLTAADVPARVGAFASFHGGGLTTDSPASPHRRVSQMKAQALIAIAADDDAKEPQSKVQLKEAFAAAKLPAEIEVYAGTVHGWCTPDMTARYNAEQAQAAWGRMLALFGRALA